MKIQVSFFKDLWGMYSKNIRHISLLLSYVFFVGVFANIQGTLFTQTLIDEYIMPLLGMDNPDFSGLAQAIFRVACFYAVGVLSSYLYNRIMINVSQGTMRGIRTDMFNKMESLPIKYLIRTRTEILCQGTQMISILLDR